MKTQTHAVLATAEDWKNLPSATLEEMQAQYHRMMGTAPNVPSSKIRSDPSELQARLNQPRVTRVGALRQLRTTMRLAPHAQHELDQADQADD